MADVKLLKYDGTEQQYRGVERVQLAKVDGGTAIFSEGEAVEGIEISLDFSSGDMPFIAPAGTLIKSAVIVKPEGLVPKNILKDVEIGGLTGELDPPDPVETEVTLDFSAGDMEVVPLDGKVFSKVIIPVPEGLVPENIAAGETVAGIEGISEGGGIDDEVLQYLGYNVNKKENTIVVCRIFYDRLYEITGNYDIVIPDTIGGYQVVLLSEP